MCFERGRGSTIFSIIADDRSFLPAVILGDESSLDSIS
jgi:hypothetical protein